MEKKKLLLVTMSVGVFLVIVIGASILVFSPRNPTPAVTAVTTPQRTVPAGVSGTLNPAVVPDGASGIAVTPRIEVAPGIAGSPVPAPEDASLETGRYPDQTRPATADPAEMVRNSGNYQALQILPGSASASAVQENRFYINSDGGQPVLIERQEEEKDTRGVINVPRPQTAAVPNVSPPPRSSSAPAAEVFCCAGRGGARRKGRRAAERAGIHSWRSEAGGSRSRSFRRTDSDSVSRKLC